jgi:hypothetical protein
MTETFRALYAKFIKSNRVAPILPIDSSRPLYIEDCTRIAFVYIEGVDSVKVDSCLEHKRGTMYHHYNQVSYQSRGVHKDFFELRRNVASLNRARADSSTPTRYINNLVKVARQAVENDNVAVKARLVKLMKAIEDAGLNTTYKKVYTIGVSHGSILLYHALLCLRSKYPGHYDWLSSGRMHLYTLGSPYALNNKGLVGGIDSDQKDPRILHIYSVHDVYYNRLARMLTPGFMVPKFPKSRPAENPREFTYDPDNRTCITYSTLEQMNTMYTNRRIGFSPFSLNNHSIYHAGLHLLFVRFPLDVSHYLAVYLAKTYSNIEIPEYPQYAKAHMHGDITVCASPKTGIRLRG